MISHILHVLQTHTPIDERERESIEKFLTVVPTLVDPCNEEADISHVTASAIVVTDAGDKVA